MKKISLFFLSFLSVLALTIPNPALATEDDDDGDVIDITILLPGESNNRSQVEVPLHAMHYAAPDRVTVSFSHDIGNVTVQITNLSYSTSTTVSECMSYLLTFVGTYFTSSELTTHFSYYL